MTYVAREIGKKHTGEYATSQKLKKNGNEHWVTARKREKAVWYAEKQSLNKAAVKFGVSIITISRWLKKYMKEGIEGLL